jgi:hypothetical protein
LGSGHGRILSDCSELPSIAAALHRRWQESPFQTSGICTMMESMARVHAFGSRSLRSAVFGAAIMAVVVVGAVACGSDGEATDVTPTTTTTTSTTTTSTTTTTTVDTPGPGGQPADEANAAVVGFMNARAAGFGADGFLTAEGAEVYATSIELYDVASFDVTGLDAADASSFQATVDITDTDGGTRTETLFVGPGTTVGGVSEPMVIRGGVVD